jgi:hypothetical protein
MPVVLPSPASLTDLGDEPDSTTRTSGLMATCVTPAKSRTGSERQILVKAANDGVSVRGQRRSLHISCEEPSTAQATCRIAPAIQRHASPPLRDAGGTRPR